MLDTQAKNIIVCADGTGNTTIKDRGTNVFKLYEAVDQNGHRKDPSLVPQVAIYHDGVGTRPDLCQHALTDVELCHPRTPTRTFLKRPGTAG